MYNFTLTCKRESSDEEVIRDFRKLALRVHPDRGGDTTHQQELNDARAKWDKARKQTGGAGRPKGPKHGAASSDMCSTLKVTASGKQAGAGAKKEFRIHASAVLLTYMGFSEGLEQFSRFLAFVKSHLKTWRIRHWSATLETTKAQHFYHIPATPGM